MAEIRDLRCKLTESERKAKADALAHGERAGEREGGDGAAACSQQLREAR